MSCIVHRQILVVFDQSGHQSIPLDVSKNSTLYFSVLMLTRDYFFGLLVIVVTLEGTLAVDPSSFKLFQ